MNLGCATGHPSFVMSASFTNQTIAQIELWESRGKGKYKNDVYVLPRRSTNASPASTLDKLGVKLTQLTPAQAEYLGVPVEGPFKPRALPLLKSVAPRDLLKTPEVSASGVFLSPPRSAPASLPA